MQLTTCTSISWRCGVCRSEKCWIWRSWRRSAESTTSGSFSSPAHLLTAVVSTLQECSYRILTIDRWCEQPCERPGNSVSGFALSFSVLLILFYEERRATNRIMSSRWASGGYGIHSFAQNCRPWENLVYCGNRNLYHFCTVISIQALILK